MLASLGYLGYAHISGGAVPTFGLPIGGQKALIRQQALRFFEHIKFKNTSAIKDFVKEDASNEDINTFMSKTFGQDPANIDLQSVMVENVELDSSKKRARSRVSLIGRDLLESRPIVLSKVIFLYLGDKNDWLIDISNLSP